MKDTRDWRLLLAGSTISTLGEGAFLAALPLLATTMTTDPRLIAGVTAWGTLPWLLAALPAGLVSRIALESVRGGRKEKAWPCSG